MKPSFQLKKHNLEKTVRFLNVIFYIDKNNKAEHKGYAKPTDAKRHLRPQSFHQAVFEAVSYLKTQLNRKIKTKRNINTKERLSKMLILARHKKGKSKKNSMQKQLKNCKQKSLEKL